MNFQDELMITLIDKGLLALVALVVAYYFNRMLHKQKARDSMLEAIAEQRIKSYQGLWEISRTAEYARKDQIPQEARESMGKKLSEWYYKNGGAMFLSFQAAKKYGSAKEVLVNPKSELREIQDAFSALRTQLKNDLRIYTMDHQGKQTINPDKLFPKDQ